ncbi:hypothetical protein GGS21DRAFT_13571 [Xylaria nigripes]|nr:hypothetical protein GGS21DRAFT_13571 [Xylaria nigripes]
MAAISMAPGPTSFTSPNDLQDVYSGWDHIPNGHNQTSNHSSTDYEGTDPSSSVSNAQQNGASDSYFDLRESRSNSPAVDQPQTKRALDGTLLTYDDENSKWIHRDKLAKIESEELQAAGITLPRPRPQSKPRRDRSHSRRRGVTDSSEHQQIPKAKKDSDLSHDKTLETDASNWDLRLPEEIAENPKEYWIPGGTGKSTRIPVAKASPAPIPTDYIDRDAPAQRKSIGSLLDEEASIMYPRSRSRSNSIGNALDDSTPKSQSGRRSAADGSPTKKTTTAGRKTPTSTKSIAQGRPKTRSGTNTRNGSSTRPPTRPGELSTKAPEGDPPWMISAYQPDPRLPPDQQLLPTVARRLQQEKWEQEGALGSVFDKEFRPLNTGTFRIPPESEKPQTPQTPQTPQETETEEVQNEKTEWPLKPVTSVTPSVAPSVAPSIRSGTNSYSTMPKILDIPTTNPLGGPKPALPSPSTVAVRVPEPPADQEETSKAGCGCCVMM